METTRSTMRRAGALAMGFLAAVAATALLGSIVQTQINLASITGLGVPVPPGLRASTTAQDAARFGPVMAAIGAVAFLPAFALAGLAARRVPAMRVAIFALAGMAGLWAAFSLMGFVTPMPTLVAAARGTPGLAALCATGLAGGIVFGLFRRVS